MTFSVTASDAKMADAFRTSFVETDTMIRLSLELPGVLLKDIEVGVQRGVLLVRGLRKTTHSHDGATFSKHHKFCRRFALDTHVVDLRCMKANLTKGVLTIQAPKKNEPTVLSIPVSVGEEELLDEEDQRDSDPVAATTLLPVVSTKKDAHKSNTMTDGPLPNVVSRDTIPKGGSTVRISVRRNRRPTVMNARYMTRRSTTSRTLNKAAC